MLQISTISPLFFNLNKFLGTFREIEMIFHDFKADLEFNDFSRAIGTLFIHDGVMSARV